MIINLEQNEFDFIVNVLGEMPTKSGAFILLQKLTARKANQPVMQPIEQPVEQPVEATVQ